MRGWAILTLGVVAQLGCNALLDLEDYTFDGKGRGGGGVGGGGSGGGDVVCTGPPPAWSFVFGGAGEQALRGAAAGPGETMVLCGAFTAPFTVGGQTLPRASGGSQEEEVFIIKLACDGSVQWAKSFGDEATNSQTCNAAATDAAGNVYVAIGMGGALTFGGPVHADAGNGDAVVVKYSASGEHLWTKGFGNDGAQSPTALAVTDGTVAVLGRSSGAVSVDAASFTTDAYSPFVLALDAATGAGLWGVGATATASTAERALAFDAAGNLAVVLSFDGTLTFGNGAFPAGGPTATYVGLFGETGAPSGSLVWGSAGSDVTATAIVGGTGAFYVGGHFKGILDIGTGPLTSSAPTTTDGFVASFSSDLAPSWATAVGDADEQYGRAVAITPDGMVLFAGEMRGTIDVSPNPLVADADGQLDVYVLRIGASQGTVHRGARYGGPGEHRVSFVGAGAPTMDLFLAGRHVAPVDFGGGPLPGGVATDFYAARLQQDF